MNHDRARQKTNGTWGYTTSNSDGLVRPIGYCNPFTEWSDQSISFFFGDDHSRYEQYVAPFRAAKDKFHDGGHLNSTEANECYKRYILDFHLQFRDGESNPQILHKCKAENCENFTNGSAICGIGYPQHFDLCDVHRNREIVETLFHVGESWHS